MNEDALRYDGHPHKGHRHEGHRHEDRGAVLILAVAFVVMVGAIGAGLAALVTSSVNNRGSLERVRDRQYAADAAIEDAIAQVRRTTTPGSDACGSVDGVSRTPGINAVNIRVDWRSACGVIRSDDGLVLVQRDVIFAACVDTNAACTDSSIIIRAQVNFEQAPSGEVTKTYVQSWSMNQ